MILILGFQYFKYAYLSRKIHFGGTYLGFGRFQIANLCNSTPIEIYGDKIRVSHGFDGCQMLEYIAISNSQEIKSRAKMPCLESQQFLFILMGQSYFTVQVDANP